MSKEHMREALNTQPFAPFAIHMADGNSYTVPARDFISMSGSGRTVALFEGEKLRVLDVMLITEIEQPPSTINPKEP